MGIDIFVYCDDADNNFTLSALGSIRRADGKHADSYYLPVVFCFYLYIYRGYSVPLNINILSLLKQLYHFFSLPKIYIINDTSYISRLFL